MAFAIEKMSIEDEERVLRGRNKELVFRFGSTDRRGRPDNWVIDRSRDAYLLRLRGHEVREDPSRYLFSLEGHLVIVQVSHHFEPLVTLLYVADPLRERLSAVRELMKEAFRIGGRYGFGPHQLDPMLVRFADQPEI